MVRMRVLASGSRGNATLVASTRTRLLVDAGLSCRELVKRLREAGEEPEHLDGIVITHEHQDHVQGVAVMARKLGIPVYFTEATHRAWVRWMTPEKRTSYAEWLAQRSQAKAEAQARAELARALRDDDDAGVARNTVIPAVAKAQDTVIPTGATPQSGSRSGGTCGSTTETAQNPTPEPLTVGPNAPPRDLDLCDEDASTNKKTTRADLAKLPAVEFFRAGTAFTVGDIEVMPFTIPHDAVDPVGFVFKTEGVKLAIATDLGYMPPNARECLKRCDVLMIEANHDPEMLRAGPYPWSVKQRVMSRVGHLSNHALAEWLTKDYDGAAHWVVLAHLSEQNNLPELARIAAESALRDRMPLLLNRVVLAEQHRVLEPIVL